MLRTRLGLLNRAALAFSTGHPWHSGMREQKDLLAKPRRTEKPKKVAAPAAVILIDAINDEPLGKIRQLATKNTLQPAEELSIRN